MDDDSKDYRRGKPQRQLYKPGSGPLKKSSYGFDSKMNSYDVASGHKAREHYGSRNSIYEGDASIKEQQSMTMNRHRRPEQPHYTARSGEGKPTDDRHSNASLRCDNSSQSFNRRRNDKHGYSNSGPRGARRNSKDGPNDINYNRNYRQVSEPRAVSPDHSVRDSSLIDRNRDSRSMETSAGRHNQSSVGKPPSGRRNSAGYSSDSPRPKYMLNFENLPPRLRKKFLEQSGHHSFDGVDYSNRDRPVSNNSTYSQGQYNTTTGWSQTLPSRGRGRLRENEHFDREKFLNTYFKNYDSRRSTPSNSYLNLYDASADNNIHLPHSENVQNHNNIYNYEFKNGISHTNEKCVSNNQDEEHSKQKSDSEAISYNSMNLADMANLDWTEEVEKDAKLEEMCDSTTSSPSLNIKTSSVSQDIRPESKSNEPREPKRRSRQRDKRSSSRGQRNEKKLDRNRRDSGQQDSVGTIQQRERKDSHRSNRSSTIGNSRDDLDRWRSLRSFSREHSTEGRIVSQCNSRDTSANRALSPRDNDGFRVPSAVPKNSNWNSNNQKKNNGSWGGGGGSGGGVGGGGGRGGSSERGRQSPAPSGAGDGPAEGSGRRNKKSSRRRRGGGGKNSENAPPAAPAAAPAHAAVNWRDEIMSKKQSSLQDRLDRHQEVNRNRLNSCQSDKSESSAHPGLLILPQGAVPQPQNDRVREGSAEVQKTLFDHHNPSKPIIVQTSSSKMDTRMDRGSSMSWARAMGAEPSVSPVAMVGAGGGAGGGAGEAARAARHRSLLMEVDRADAILQTHSLRGPVSLAAHWTDVTETRKFLQSALERLLLSDLKYCQADNVEHRFWKILYYNFIEVLRKSVSQSSPEDKQRIVKLINMIIEEGNVYFENLVHLLEKTYKFNTEDYINGDHVLPPKGMGYVGLAMISVQKMYVFLGDLARYTQQVNETNNYAKSKFWYTKAQQINPKNGRPYNQLAILAIYARRKLDAVYYYMRSLMSSNPFHSARESLLSLFDENRKKYEAAERKRRAVLEANDNLDGHEWSKPTRREVWVRPGGGAGGGAGAAGGDDGLAAMTPVELNKNFITSYLHVHGKLVTKIGMETFHESAGKMLRQFRALLHQQPLPTPPARLLQLTALNMFAVESCSTHPDSDGSRCTWLECAVGVSLLMFGALLERCCALLPEPAASQHHADALLLLPAIKVWSDWMLCHSSKWNPPPSLDQFDIGNDNDPWDWLAKLMNILEALDDKSVVFENEMKEGYEAVRLAEDAALAGFTPLMYMEPATAFVRGGGCGGGGGGGGGAGGGGALPPHLAEHALRTRKLLFFGTEYLVGVEPPVLKLEYPAAAAPRYVSAVQRPAPRPDLHHLSEDEEEEITAQEREVSNTNGKALSGEAPETDEATRRLLRRKEQLESRRASLERRKLRVQELLKSGARVEVEVRPRWLVPDTNCFIDQLALLRRCVEPTGPVTLAVPLVVITELEGLQKCARVGAQAASALEWLSPAPPGVKFATSRGSLLSSRAFTAEQEQSRATNDDRVLATALSLHANVAGEPDVDGVDGVAGAAGAAGAAGVAGAAGCVRRVREVVLLTDDRNLRVKALAAELPVRDLPSFVAWAGFKGPSSQDEENKPKAV